MPQMTGIEFLAEAPAVSRCQARPATAYADTDVAINAINQIKLDYYLSSLGPARLATLPSHQRSAGAMAGILSPPFEGIRLAIAGHLYLTK
jgi:thioredoxin reductase (NADPH)